MASVFLLSVSEVLKYIWRTVRGLKELLRNVRGGNLNVFLAHPLLVAEPFPLMPFTGLHLALQVCTSHFTALMASGQPQLFAFAE